MGGALASYTWTGGDNSNPTDFSDPLNWDPITGPPAAGDDATITDSATLPVGDAVEIPTNGTEVSNLTIDDGALDDNGNQLTVDSSLVLGQTATTNGTSNSLLSVEGKGDIGAYIVDIGQDVDANGSLTITGPATFAATTSITDGDSGIGYVFDYGGTLTAGTDFIVGNAAGSQGYADFYDGAQATITGDLDVAAQDGSYGSVTVDGTGTLITVKGNVNLGSGGDLTAQANFQISNGAQFIDYYSFNIFVSNNEGQSPTVLVENPDSYLQVNGQLSVGFNGQGWLDVEDGAGVTANDGGAATNAGIAALLVDSSPSVSGAEGLLTIDGTVGSYDYEYSTGNMTSTVTVFGPMVVGSYGVAEVDITNGGFLYVQAGTQASNSSNDLFLDTFPNGVSGLGQYLGSTGTIDVKGDGEVQLYSGGSFLGNEFLPSTFNIDVLKVGAGDTNPNPAIATGGTGYLNVSDGAVANIYDELDIAYDQGTTGSVDVSGFSPDLGSPAYGYGFSSDVGQGSQLNLYGFNYIGGNAAVEAGEAFGGTAYLTIDGSAEAADESATNSDPAPVVYYGEDLVLDPGGTLDLDNGILAGDGGGLILNGGTFQVTPVADQIDDQHSVLLNVNIQGQDLSVTGAVLTLADSTYGDVVEESELDNVLIDATSSLIDLRQDSGAELLTQIITLTDSALTVDASAPVAADVDGGGGGGSLSSPNFYLTSATNADGATVYGQVVGTGAIFSDYINDYGTGDPSPHGYFSGEVWLDNQGLIDAYANDSSLDPAVPGQLSILTDIITNDADGTFEADSNASLNIGNADTPLGYSYGGDGSYESQYDHVFTNLVANTDGTTTSLVDGFYDANGGDITINGNDSSGNPLNPISTLSAVLYLTNAGSGNGDLLVNGVPIEDSLTTITPSTDAGEGDLAINNTNITFANPIDVQSLQPGEPTSWTINSSGINGEGGGLYLDDGTFTDPDGLTIDASSYPGGPSAFIYGDGTIDAPVTMNGQVGVWDYNGDSVLAFEDPVTGGSATSPGVYQIYQSPGNDTVLFFNSTLGTPGQSYADNIVNFNNGPSSETLWLEPLDITDGFRATITNFGPNDDIVLWNVHATSATFDSTTDQLDLFNAAGVEVATLQLDNTIAAGQQFEVAPVGGNGGGTDIRLANPSFGPAISGGPSSGAVTAGANPPVETVQADYSYSDVNPSYSNPYYAVIEGGDAPLGSLTVSGGPLVGEQGPDGQVVVTQNSGQPLDLTYSVADSAIQYLQAGEQKVDQFYIELSDGQATTVQPYSVTITGTNQPPVIGNIDLPTTGWATDGAATVSTAAHPDDTTGGNLYNLLPTDSGLPGEIGGGNAPANALGQAGAIWQQVNLSQSFTLNAELFFGTGVFDQFDGGGADGITFTLQAEGTNAIGSANQYGVYPTSGGLLGIGGTVPDSDPAVFVPGITDAMGVKFDTFNNGPPAEPVGDSSFAQFFDNGDEETPASANPAQINTGNLDNGSWHDLVVTWTPLTATTGQLTYTLDGTITELIVENTSVFGSSPVFAGFTGASGSAYSPEQVEIVSFTNGTQPASAFAGAVTEIAGLTTAQLPSAGNLTASGVIDFSDVNQLDTHTASVPVADESVVANPYYSGPVLGTLTAQVTQDTTGTGNDGTVAWTFSVPDSAIAFLNAGQQIQEDFVVDVADDNGGVTPQTISVTINGSTNQPTANPDTYSDTYLHTLTVDAAQGVLANDTDPDATPLTASLDQGPQHGSLTLNSDGSFSYTPNAGFIGSDSFIYTATDETLSSEATATISVTDQAPIVQNESYTVLHGQTIIETGGTAGTGLLAGDSDPDGNPLSVQLLTVPQHGSLSYNANDGSFSYTASESYVGSDSFTYAVSDGALTTDGTATITVTDQAPVVQNESYTVLHGQTIIETGGTTGTGLLAGDSDPDGDTLSVQLLTEPQHGSLSYNANDGSFNYTAAESYVGSDSFTYAVSDGALTTDGTATITVTDQAPVVQNESYTVLHGQTIIETGGTTGTGLLAGDSDPDGDTLSVQLLTEPQHGSLSYNANDGSFNYTAAESYVGSDSFTYAVSDGALTTDGTATITVTDQAPVVQNESYTVLHGQTIIETGGTAGTGLLAGDSDPDGDTLSVQLLTDPQHGSLSYNANDGSFSYTAAESYVGPDSFTYAVSDGALTTDGTANITVTDQAPIAYPETYSASPGQTIIETGGTTGTGLLAGDSDPDGDTLSVQLLTDPQHGSLSYNPNDGSFTYTANPIFIGTDTFTFDVSDGAIAVPETATITVSSPCYCPGTLILTERGEFPVEKLAIGDRVMTASGAARPIKWIGRRSYAGRFVMGRKDILPICIRARRFGRECTPPRSVDFAASRDVFRGCDVLPAC